MILTDYHKGLVAVTGLRQRDGQGGRQVKHFKGVERVPVPPDRNLIVDIIGVPRMGKLATNTETLNVGL